MKRKILIIMLAIGAVLCSVLGCVACSGNEGSQDNNHLDDNFVWTTQSAYNFATDLGYEGSLEEFIALISGEDGVGIDTISVNASGELIVTLTNDNSINCGVVVGKGGQDGQDGVGVTKTEIDDDGNLIIYLTNGTTVNCGKVIGEDGTPGEDGQDGVGISKAEIDDDGNLIIYLTNGTTVNCGKVTGEDGKPGEDGQNGVGISVTRIDNEGNLIVILTDGTEYFLGKVTGTDGMSAYEIYLKYHPDYVGTEEQWIKDLASGRLELLDYSTIEYIPELNYTVAAGEEIILPEEVNVYFTDGDVQPYTVEWSIIPDSKYVGMKKAYGVIKGIGLEITCNVQVTNYSSRDRYINGYVNGILGHDCVTVTLYNDSTLISASVSEDGYFCFDSIEYGVYYIKVDAVGYMITEPQKVEISALTVESSSLYNNIGHSYFYIVASRTPGYYFVWTRTDGKGNTETEAAVNTEIDIDFLDDNAYVSNVGDASYLRDKYDVVLNNNELVWSTEASSRFLELYERIPSSVTNGLKSVWTLTDEHLQNDISFTENGGVYNVTVSMDAVENMTPRVAVAN